jgi:hypothetical protein
MVKLELFLSGGYPLSVGDPRPEDHRTHPRDTPLILGHHAGRYVLMGGHLDAMLVGQV